MPFGGLEAFFDGLALSATETKINRASPSLSEKLFGGFGFVRRAAGFLVTPEAPEVENCYLLPATFHLLPATFYLLPVTACCYCYCY